MATLFCDSAYSQGARTSNENVYNELNVDRGAEPANLLQTCPTSPPSVRRFRRRGENVGIPRLWARGRNVWYIRPEEPRNPSPANQQRAALRNVPQPRARPTLPSRRLSAMSVLSPGLPAVQRASERAAIRARENNVSASISRKGPSENTKMCDSSVRPLDLNRIRIAKV